MITGAAQMDGGILVVNAADNAASGLGKEIKIDLDNLTKKSQPLKQVLKL